MTKLTLAYVLVGIGTACMPARAAGQVGSSIISFPGKVSWSWETRPSGEIQAVDPNSANLVVIFSNFGTKNHLYESNVAWDVAGPDSGVQQQWVAMPFTPRFEARVTQIAIAVEHNSGTPNSFVLSLNADNGGQVPGKVLHSWLVTHAPKFGKCCAVDIARDNGIAVKKGIQYWIVAKTNNSENSTRMEWDLSPLGIEGNFAFNHGQGWYEYTAFTSAFAVYGKKVNQVIQLNQ